VILPQNVKEIKDRQTNVVLAIRDVEVIFEAEDFGVPDICAVKK
jgi:hypothetical protein